MVSALPAACWSRRARDAAAPWWIVAADRGADRDPVSNSWPDPAELLPRLADRSTRPSRRPVEPPTRAIPRQPNMQKPCVDAPFPPSPLRRARVHESPTGDTVSAREHTALILTDLPPIGRHLRITLATRRLGVRQGISVCTSVGSPAGTALEGHVHHRRISAAISPACRKARTAPSTRPWTWSVARGSVGPADIGHSEAPARDPEFAECRRI